MKLTQLLLCNTPFTPSYEHLVTGCSSTEFYNKLATEDSTQTISPVLTPNITFRPVRETDREIVFSLNMIGENALYIKPQDYNYVATYEQYPTSRRFWFIESYNVDNSGLYPTVTFYCSIDYWHSYILDNNNDVKEQRIVRKKSNDPYIYIPDDIDVPHDEYLVPSRRILWARCRVSTTEFKQSTSSNPVVVDTELGLPYDGGMVTLYVPLIHFLGEDIVDYSIGVRFLTKHRIATMNFTNHTITASNTGSANAIYTQSFQIGHAINNLASIATILDLSLTFIPPINFTYTSDDGIVDVREDGTGLTPVLIKRDGYPSMYAFTYFSESHYPFEFTKRVNLLSTINIGYDKVYPFDYYKIYVGGQPYIFPYPISTVDVEFKAGGSANSMSCNLYVNTELVEKNISICQNIPLPINVTEADLINARYLNGYREMGLSLSLANSVLNIGGSMVNVFNASSIASSVIGGISSMRTAMNSAYNIAGEYYRYESQGRTPAKQFYPVTEALSAIIGDYPYIISCTVNRGYSSMVADRLNVIGHKTDYYDKPLSAPANGFEYYKIDPINIFSSNLNDRGNGEIISAFTRGVHLWDYRLPLNIIGIYN